MVSSHDEKTIVLPKKDLRGSRLRFLMLTSIPKEQIAKTLNDLVSPWASVDPLRDHWMPNGFLDSTEAKLGECQRFLSTDIRSKLTQWWLKVPENANTPNWDLVSTCKVEGRPGILLIEGKAHAGELKEEGKRPGNTENDKLIKRAIEDANQGLNQITPGWNLCRDSHYQLCNRFAWAWKVAALGIPTILIYLGFLHATEMLDRGKPFDSPEEWNKVIREHSSNALAAGASIVPTAAWESSFKTPGAPLWALIRSLDHRWSTDS
jgi:hypothetical protein